MTDEYFSVGDYITEFPLLKKTVYVSCLALCTAAVNKKFPFRETIILQSVFIPFPFHIRFGLQLKNHSSKFLHCTCSAAPEEVELECHCMCTNSREVVQGINRDSHLCHQRFALYHLQSFVL